METKPLHIYPWPNALLSHVKTAKAELGLPFLLAPKAAVPGGGCRVLATEPPPFACEHALVGALGFTEMKAALLWVTGIKEYDARATTIADQFSMWMHGDVKEIRSDA